ncbi:MAG: AAA family ATPase [Candidatus Omnitrophica bacterium]|nr:AAA family ATPase [Candidatus Omnitrophota bacterium]
MFTEIGIENFKAFGKMQSIPLKPITLIYGPNSSGKSSLLQSLLLFKQTLEEGSEEVVLLPKGSLVDLGSVSEFIHKHNLKKDFKLSLSFKHLWSDGWMYQSSFPENDQLKMEFSFFSERIHKNTTQIFVKEINLFYESESKPFAKYKNVWFFPELRRLIVQKTNAARKNNEDNNLIEKWISDVKRSILVLESINLKSKLIKEQWNFFAGKDFKDRPFYNDYLSLTGRLKQRLKSDMKVMKGIKSNKKKREMLSKFIDNIKLGNDSYELMEILKERLGFSTSDLFDTEQKEIKQIIDHKRFRLLSSEEKLLRAIFGEKECTIFQEREKPSEKKGYFLMAHSENEKIGQTISFLERLVKSLMIKNYRLFSNSTEIPYNRLISLLNCFPNKQVDENDWIFQYMLEFECFRKSFMDSLDIGKIVIHDYIMTASSLLSKYLRQINYIGPLREYPERSYSFSGNILSSVGKTGNNMPDILLGRSNTIDIINKWFKIFNINYNLLIDQKEPDLFTLSLFDEKSKCRVSTKDVGFGISQILPILVQGVISEHSIICIEQPEIHIHPRLQSELGSFIADCADRWQDVKAVTAKGESPQRPGNQFIIETHSEHLILRLLRLIRETTNGELKEGEKPLRPEDVAVIYAKPTEHGTELMELRISEDGDFIDKWPDGFFTERARELF